jgi:putative DNA primase/helicase
MPRVGFASATGDAAARLTRRGFAVCKPAPGGKAPTYPGWPTFSLDPGDFDDGDELGIIAGPLSHGNKAGHALVIIDADAPEAVEKADEFLPATAMCEGREGKPKDHQYFLVPLDTIPDWARSKADQAAPAAEEFAGHPGPWVKRFKHAETRKSVVDFLGTGGQCVCPYPGGRRRWVGGKPGEPAVVPFEELWAATCKLAVACGAKLPEANGKAKSPPPPPDDAVIGRCVAYLAKVDPAVAGQGGHDGTYWPARVACYGFALGENVGFEVLRDHFNPRCSPPWSEKELRHKCADADRLPFDKPRGWLLHDQAPGRGGDEQPHLTDAGNADRLARDHGDDLRFCHPWQKWLCWDGRRWRPDDTGEAVRRARDTVRRLYDEARDEVGRLKAAAEGGEAVADRLRAVTATLTWALRSEAAPRLAAMLTLARPALPVLPAAMDRDPFLLNAGNGTLDLRTGELREHRREDMLTKLCPTPYDPHAQCPQFLRALGGMFQGDKALVGYVRRFAGYCLTGDVREAVTPIAHGPGGNGKTVLFGALLDAVGPDYGGMVPPELLLETRGEQHPTVLADLFGKRLMVAAETPEGGRLNEGRLKALTGGDRVKARRMREDFWEFEPTHKLVIFTNHRPEVRGTDHGIWRRLALWPFAVRFWDPDKGESGPAELQADKGLPGKLRAEREGILAWMVRGCLAWQRDGLKAPASVCEATEEYRGVQDVLAAFLEERCDTGPRLKCRASDLYDAYRWWAKGAGEHELSRRRFGLALTERGFERYTNDGTWYRGVARKDEGSVAG